MAKDVSISIVETASTSSNIQRIDTEFIQNSNKNIFHVKSYLHYKKIKKRKSIIYKNRSQSH